MVAMSLISSAFYCAALWAVGMLWLANALDLATIVLALAGGAVAGIAWYEERAAKLADRDRTR
jgi:uncharacterized protein (DUF697 family)